MSTTRRTAGVWNRKRPLGPNGEKICYNCGGPLPKGRCYNCSAACSEAWRLKTSPTYMRFMVHKRDNGVCALCGVDTDRLQDQYRKLRGTAAEDFRKEWGIPLARAIGDWWDADHIKPVIEGGGECGLDNYRTLCIPCHQKVTAELHARRAQRKRQAKANERWAQWHGGGTAPEVRAKTAPRSSSAADLQESLFGSQGG